MGFGMSVGVADTIGIGAVVAVITYTSLIIGELVPKQIALHNPEAVAAPESTPTRVIPIWTVERNLPGSDASESARRDPLTFISTIRRRRAGRDETIANSDIASKPLSMMSTTTMQISATSMEDNVASGTDR